MASYQNPKVRRFGYRTPSKKDENFRRNVNEVAICMIIAIVAFAVTYALFGFEWLK